MIRYGATVTVFPQGKPEQAAIGTVMIISENQRSIAVNFADKPAFVNMMKHGAFLCAAGVIMLALRDGADLPWIEVTSGSRVEIEVSQ